mgnify:CR=1 FL=1
MKQNLISTIFDKNIEGKIIKINLEEISLLSELKNAFKMDEEVKNRIKLDMHINGFSKAHPIHIFRWEEKWILCDGHTRYTAAKELELKTIWAQVHQFDSINQALLYSMKEQFNRRNIEDSELFKQFEILRQEEIDGRKLTANEMSERLKKSRRHIFKLQEVFAKSSKEQLQSIRDGEVSINQVYNEIKNQELEAQKNSKVEENNFEELSISVEQGTKNIDADLENNEKNELQKKHRKLQEKELELKKKELELANPLSNKEIFLLGIKFALIEKSKGKLNKEIINSVNKKTKMNLSEFKFTEEELNLLKTN